MILASLELLGLRLLLMPYFEAAPDLVNSDNLKCSVNLIM